jgi:Holliday junction resolvase
VSGYSDGRRVEWAVRDHLTDNGYEVMRGSSSKGFADICALKPLQALVISCKRTTMPGPAERAQLLRTASLLGGIGVPLVALKPLRQPLTFRRLTGPGPKQWEPWHPDEAAHEQGDVADDGGDDDPWGAA